MLLSLLTYLLSVVVNGCVGRRKYVSVAAIST